MFRILVSWMVFVLSACSGGEPAAQQGPAAKDQPAAAVSGGAASDERPDEQMVACLNRFREKKYEEALTVCGQALRANPGDPQILKAIELSEEALKDNGGA